MSKVDIDGYVHRYLAKFNNLEKPQGPLFIFFSALHGAGKSTLANKLAGDLDVFVLSLDAIKEMAEAEHLSYEEFLPARFQIFRKIWDDVYQNHKNKVIIFDVSIDDAVDDENKVLRISERMGIPSFIIRINVDKAEAERRIMARNRDDQARTLSQLDDLVDLHNQAEKRLKFDYIFTNDNDYEGLLSNIKERIQ